METYDFMAGLRRANAFIRERGVGNQEHPVILDPTKHPTILMHKLEHAHDLNGKCIKNRTRIFCEQD